MPTTYETVVPAFFEKRVRELGRAPVYEDLTVGERTAAARCMAYNIAAALIAGEEPEVDYALARCVQAGVPKPSQLARFAPVLANIAARDEQWERALRSFFMATVEPAPTEAGAELFLEAIRDRMRAEQ